VEHLRLKAEKLEERGGPRSDRRRLRRLAARAAIQSTSHLIYASVELSSNRDEASQERSLDIVVHGAEEKAVAAFLGDQVFAALRRLGKDS
jgi:hypothetical protein